MTYGPVAQWESVRFTRGRSLVRSQPGPQKNTEGVPDHRGRLQSFESTAVRGHGYFGMQTVVAGRRATISVAWSKRHFATEKVTALSTEKVDSSVDDSDLSVFQDAESRWERWARGNRRAAHPQSCVPHRRRSRGHDRVRRRHRGYSVPRARLAHRFRRPRHPGVGVRVGTSTPSFREGSIRPVHGMVRQASLFVKGLGVLFTTVIVLATLWVLGTFGLIGTWVGLDYSWLESPL